MSDEFLFFDTQDFLYGTIGFEKVSVNVRAAVVASTRKVAGVCLAATMMCAAMSGDVKEPVSSIVSNLPWTLAPPTWQKSADVFVEEAKKNLIRGRQYLGLSQVELAAVLGASPSTLEKFEQGLSPNPSPEFLNKYKAFAELCDILKNAFQDRKFIVRSIVTSPLSALGDVSPLEYAKAHPEKGIFYVFRHPSQNLWMILYRTFPAHRFRVADDIIDTSWSALSPGRWNDVGVEVLYAADCPEVAICEGAYHFVLQAEVLINLAKRSARSPEGWDIARQNLIEKKMLLAEVEVNDDLPILDLSSEPEASKFFQKNGFDLTVQRYRHDSFVKLGDLTQRFGASTERSKYQAIRVKSARTDEGACIIIFRRNHSGFIRVHSFEEIFFTAATSKGPYAATDAASLILTDTCYVRKRGNEQIVQFLRVR